MSAPRTPLVIVCLVAAAFTVILNETTMLIAVRPLANDLGVSLNAAQWLTTAFLLTMAAVIPVTGWYLARVTTRTAFTVAMVTFCTGTLVCLVAPAFWVLLAGRIIQALGTAVMMPLLMTTLMAVVPESDRGRVMGNVTMAMSVAPALGPPTSGLLLWLGSWRLIFAVVLPIAIFVTVAGLRRLENVSEPRASAIDWPSVGIAALGFGGFVYGLSEFATGARARPTLIVLAGLVGIVIFGLRQQRLARTGTPLLDPGVLAFGAYRRGLSLLAVGFGVMLGAMTVLPLYLQDVRDLSTLQTGLLVMPGGLAMGLLSTRVGAIFDRHGGRYLIVGGSLGLLLCTFTLSRIDGDTPYWLLIAVHMLMMISLASIFTPAFTLTLGAVTPQLYSHASSMLGTLQQIAGALGTALAITLLTARAESLAGAGDAPLDAAVGGMRLALLVAAVGAVAVVALALRMPNRPTTPAEPVAVAA